MQEVDAAGYARQPIEFFEDFAGGCRGTLQNSQRVSFEPVHAWEEATHVGIFDGWSHGRRIIVHAPYPGADVRKEAIWTNSWFAGTLRLA